MNYHITNSLEDIHARLSSLIHAGGTSTHSHRGIMVEEEIDTSAAMQHRTDCQQINQSAGGAAFLLSGADTNRVMISDLVLLESTPKSDIETPVGFAARVRRLIQHDNGNLEVGVARLTGKLIPVSLTDDDRSGLPALLQGDAKLKDIHLYAPGGTFRQNIILNVNGTHSNYRLRMVALEETLRHYEVIRVISEPAS